MRPGILALLVLTLATPALAGDDPTSYPRLTIGGFTDVNFFAIDDDDAETSSGFKEGQFVLHFTSLLSSRISFFGEVSLTAKDDQYKIEVERSIIKFDQSDFFKLSFGRYHTPINWWNTAFHHGQWLQTSVSRPEMTKFGGDFIPVHFIGGLAEGRASAGGLNLRYQLGIGNGRHEIISRGGDAGDVNNSRAWLTNLSVRPDAAYSLLGGISYYSDRIDTEDDRSFDESIAAAYLVWLKETPELIGEYAVVQHEDRDSGESWDADAFYVQVAYRLPVNGAKWKPYARYEQTDVEVDADPVYGNLDDRKALLGGIRYDLSSFLAVKLEYRRVETNDVKTVNGGYAQISFAF